MGSATRSGDDQIPSYLHAAGLTVAVKREMVVAVAAKVLLGIVPAGLVETTCDSECRLGAEPRPWWIHRVIGLVKSDLAKRHRDAVDRRGTSVEPRWSPK